jgi:aspartyl-tRNA(Asn)/glutamyl-tRNA(Gln) amidotransferase subunit C
MPSTLARADVEHLARLAQLELSDADLTQLTDQLRDILGYAAEIAAIDTTGVAPTSHPFTAATLWRDDEPRPSLIRDDVLSSAPDADTSTGLFRVPRVL